MIRDGVYIGQDLFTDNEIYEFNKNFTDIKVNEKIQTRNEKSTDIANLIGTRVLQNFEKTKCCDELFLYKARKKLFLYDKTDVKKYIVLLCVNDGFSFGENMFLGINNKGVIESYTPKKNQVIVFDSSITIVSEYISHNGEAIHYIGTELFGEMEI
jgi:hypothetical protein